jgi:hypothetical protein
MDPMIVLTMIAMLTVVAFGVLSEFSTQKSAPLQKLPSDRPTIVTIDQAKERKRAILEGRARLG